MWVVWKLFELIYIILSWQCVIYKKNKKRADSTCKLHFCAYKICMHPQISLMVDFIVIFNSLWWLICFVCGPRIWLVKFLWFILRWKSWRFRGGIIRKLGVRDEMLTKTSIQNQISLRITVYVFLFIYYFIYILFIYLFIFEELWLRLLCMKWFICLPKIFLYCMIYIVKRIVFILFILFFLVEMEYGML